jgi:hypothetical protein
MEVSTITVWLLYLWERTHNNPFGRRRLGGPQSWSGYNNGYMKFLPLLGNETQLFLFNIVMRRKLYHMCGKLEVHTKFVFESLEGRDYLGQLCVDGRAEFKWILQK